MVWRSLTLQTLRTFMKGNARHTAVFCYLSALFVSLVCPVIRGSCEVTIEQRWIMGQFFGGISKETRLLMGPVNLQHYLMMYCFHTVQYFKMFIIYYLSWNSKGKKKKKRSMFFRKTLQRGTFWVPALKVPYKFCYTDFLNSVKGKRPPSKCTGDSHRRK